MFNQKFWKCFSCEVKNIMWDQIEPNTENSEKLKCQFGQQGPLVAIFDHYYVVIILGVSHYQKLTKIDPMVLSFKKETCSKKQTSPSLGQSLNQTCRWPSWMQPLPKTTKMVAMAPPLKIKTCNENQTFLVFSFSFLVYL